MGRKAHRNRESRNRGQDKTAAPVMVIDTPKALDAFCKRLSKERFVTVDTEFMRERTFWPRLCLIQMAGANEAAVIDPLAEGMDLAPFIELMANESVLKVFHAGRQDIEIIHHLAGIIPRPLFDTQVAAMVCGFGDQVGYEALVNRLAGARIDKGARFTDWSRRPLSEQQLRYALSDVTHLRVIFERLCAMLKTSGREPWLKEEMDLLTDPETYAQRPEDAWKRVKFRPRDARQLAAMQRLAAWREEEAQRRDLPRRRILKDEALVELATQMPETKEDLARLRLFPEGLVNNPAAERILAVIREVRALPEEKLPAMPERRKAPPEGASARADVLKLALKIVCERENLAPRLVASAADIEALAAGRRDLPLLRGWRRQVFGDLALKLLEGKRVIGLRNGKPDIFPAPSGAH